MQPTEITQRGRKAVGRLSSTIEKVQSITTQLKIMELSEAEMGTGL